MRNRKHPLLESLETLERREFMSGLAVMISAVEDPSTAPVTPPITLPIGNGGSNGWAPGTIGNPVQGSGLLGAPVEPSSDPIAPGDYNGPTWAVPLC